MWWRMPKLTISLSKELYDELLKDGSSPSEKVKELIKLYVERTTRATERGKAVVELLREVDRGLERALKASSLDEISEEFSSAIRLVKVAIDLILQLPLTPGEEALLEALRGKCEQVLELLKKFKVPAILYASSILSLALVALTCLLIDLGAELHHNTFTIP